MPATWTFLHRQERRLVVLGGDHRFDRLFDLVELEVERPRQQRHRLAHADVAEAPGRHLLIELLLGEPGADLLLQRQPPRAGVDDARALHGLHVERDRRGDHGDEVHRVARVHAGAEERHAAGFRRRVELLRQRRVLELRHEQFLGRRHHVDAAARRQQQLVLHHRHEARGAVQHHVGLQPLQGRLGVRLDDDTGLAAEFEQVAEVLADLRRDRRRSRRPAGRSVFCRARRAAARPMGPRPNETARTTEVMRGLGRRPETPCEGAWDGSDGSYARHPAGWSVGAAESPQAEGDALAVWWAGALPRFGIGSLPRLGSRGARGP
jgi:hypothetical protein